MHAVKAPYLCARAFWLSPSMGVMRELVGPAVQHQTQVGGLSSSRLAANGVPVQEARAVNEVGQI